MSVTPESKEAIRIVEVQLRELIAIGLTAKASRDARLGLEKLNRWRDRTVRLLSENIHPNEGQKLRHKPIYDFRTYGIALENLLDAVSIYSRFLESLLEELKEHPEDVLDVPTPSREKAKTMEAPEPIYLFDSMQFHPRIIEASKRLFVDGHYRDAILRAFVEVNSFVKVKTGLELDGRALMTQVFKVDDPIIRLNELKTKSEKDEQEGFMFLFMGAMVGIRNPKAHDNIIQTDPFRTLEYLALASLLMKRVEEGVC